MVNQISFFIGHAVNITTSFSFIADTNLPSSYIAATFTEKVSRFVNHFTVGIDITYKHLHVYHMVECISFEYTGECASTFFKTLISGYEQKKVLN